jgi:hypothetical protein
VAANELPNFLLKFFLFKLLLATTNSGHLKVAANIESLVATNSSHLAVAADTPLLAATLKSGR